MASLALTTNVSNYLHKGLNLSCVKEAYRKNGVMYLYGLMGGLAAFLRIQGHQPEEVMDGVDTALKDIGYEGDHEHLHHVAHLSVADVDD